ncbi:HAD family hydrolase [Promicromonospora sukumoe]|uniref:HAD family hydrolase n=1 Tax=Promicromonospora sukumoe TaxID=88382 RepID=UPI000377BE25|nr:HAD family hydrolase [Promicromonospora sukumoe]
MPDLQAARGCEAKYLCRRGAARRYLVALDIDGTLLPSGTRVPQATIDAVGLVRTAGHHVVLATGRTLASTLAVAKDLGLTNEWIVASNGAVTARLENTALGGYRLHARHTFDARPVVRLARLRLGEVSIATEDFGRGWLVTEPFRAGLLNGRQRVIDRHDELWAMPTTRVVLAGPSVTSLVSSLHRLGVRATPEGVDRVNVTADQLSKASALELVRAHLSVPPDDTFAIGDGVNDTEMLAWAAHGVAMGQADARVKAVAASVTGSVDEQGAAGALLSLAAGQLPQPACRLLRLGQQLGAHHGPADSPGTSLPFADGNVPQKAPLSPGEHWPAG